MNKIKKKLFMIYSIILSLLLTSLVSAQTRLSDAVKDLKMLDIAKTYATIPSIIDFLLLYALFLHIFRDVLKKREFPKPVAIILAIIAALGGVIGLNQLNTNLILFARPVMYLALAFLIIKNFGTENKAFNAGLGFLIAYKMMEMLEKTAPNVADFPFFTLLKAVFMFAGFILMGWGIWQIVGGVFGKLGGGGTDSKGVDKKLEISDNMPPEKKGKSPESEEEALKKFKKELQKLVDYLKDLMKELRNYGLLSAEEVEKAEKQHSFLTHVYALFLKEGDHRLKEECVELIEDLTKFKRELDESEKSQWWGRRTLNRLANREEQKVKEIESTLNYLRTYPDLQQIVTKCQGQFHQIDNLFGYVREINEKLIDEHKATKVIDTEINKLIGELSSVLQDKHKNIHGLADVVKGIDARLGSLIELLKQAYESIRDAMSQAQNINKELNSVHEYLDSIAKNL